MLKEIKTCFILGTRPEIIKMSSLIREFTNKKYNFFILHTNQHYSTNLDKIFFKELNIPSPKYNLKIGSGSHGEQTGKMIIAIEKILMKERPEIVFVEGDTNTVLSGALAASKLHIKIAHIDSDEMPEEINRVVVDHISDYLISPTKEASRILNSEGIESKKIVTTGNTIADAVYQNLKVAKKSKILLKQNLSKGKYLAMTLHREENVENEKKLNNIFKAINKIYQDFSIPIIFPIHPRTKKNINKYKIKIPKGIKTIQPLGYMDFLWLENNSRLILTDSGGIQEEACILGVPCVTLREDTERPETLRIGANILAGNSEIDKIFNSFKLMMDKKIKWKNPYGEGNAYKKTIDFINSRI